jgi:hypothetical protein
MTSSLAPLDVTCQKVIFERQWPYPDGKEEERGFPFDSTWNPSTILGPYSSFPNDRRSPQKTNSSEALNRNLQNGKV